MKVKCKKFLSPFGDGMELESSGFLTIGREYIVLAIDINKRNVCKVYIEDDSKELPGYFDIRQFDVVSNYIPSRWVIEYREEFNSLAFYPKSWVEHEDFWDRFIDDHDPEMIALFEKERDLIYEEEPKKIYLRVDNSSDKKDSS